MVERFARERVRHELRRRRLAVMRTERIAPGMQRVTLGGSDLEGFAAPGPADHIKLFFPDPASPGEMVSRDYTPLAFRPAERGGPELDVDFYLHGSDANDTATGSVPAGGPAAAWAASAVPGDEIETAGPRGSALPPAGVESAVLIADEAALPAMARWIEALGEVPILGLFSVSNAGTSAYLSGYEAERRKFRWFDGDDRNAQIAAALRALRIDEGAFLFLAGEATSLIPLRRYLRRELGLSKEQAGVHGYWKRGVVALDHHAPLDPSDPED